MPRRSPIDGLFDALTRAAGDAAQDLYQGVADGLYDRVREAINPAPPTRIPTPYPHSTPKRQSPTPSRALPLKQAIPMRIRKPKTWTQLCNWLAGLGLGNRYYPDEGPITLVEIQAVTVHVVDRDGVARDLQLVLDPQWRNPWVKERQG